MRALGLDLGTRRIGVAVSDDRGAVASPIETLQRGRDHATDHEAVAALVDEWGVGVVVVGLPLSLDGCTGPAAQRTLAEIDEMRGVLNVPVETHDERFTTVTADQRLREQGVRGAKRTAVIDQVAAAVLLQSWLERA